jgi:hypothetical protein
MNLQDRAKRSVDEEVGQRQLLPYIRIRLSGTKSSPALKARELLKFISFSS